MGVAITSVPMSRSVADTVRAEAKGRRFKLYAYMDAAARVFAELTPEQRAIAIATAQAASPSTGDAVQCDQRTPPNQAKTPQPRVARRKAG